MIAGGIVSKPSISERLKAVWHSLTKLEDTPHAIALGAALGVGWNFIPSLGVGPVLSIVSAKLFGASGVAAVTANLGTGFFIPLLYSLNLATGRGLTGNWPGGPAVEQELSGSIVESVEGIELVLETPSRFFGLSRIAGVGMDFVLGSLVNAVVFGIVLYILFMTPVFIRNLSRRFSKKNTDQAAEAATKKQA